VSRLKDKIFKLLIFAFVFAGLMGLANTIANADIYGSDVASYQGSQGSAFGEFQIAKLGGDAGVYINPYYEAQVNSALSRGQRAHTYLWFENITSIQQAENFIQYYLPRVKTPKGSIVTLDIESGWQNNDVISYTLKRIRDWGYTSVYYSYKPFTISNGIDTDRFAREAGYANVWIAGYGTNNGQIQWNYFPSMNNVAIWQYSSILGDRNIDLTGITYNGYSSIPIQNSQQSNDIAKPVDNSANQQFRNAGNRFTAYKSFRLDEIKFVNGMWQGINYELAGGTDFDWTLNGIPLDIVDADNGQYYVNVGDYVHFADRYNFGTIDYYDDNSHGVGIIEGRFGNIWYNSDKLLEM
jgi:hypothetical protein